MTEASAIAAGVALCAMDALVSLGVSSPSAVRAMAKRIRVSPHLRMDELTVSARAAKLHLTNVPTPAECVALWTLATEIAEPIRERYGPVRVTSAFRSRLVNAAVGGSKTSDHRHGYALDFDVVGRDNEEVFEDIVSSGLLDELPIDQLIYYRKQRHIHVSHAAGPAGGDSPRRMAGIDPEDGRKVQWL